MKHKLDTNSKTQANNITKRKQINGIQRKRPNRKKDTM